MYFGATEELETTKDVNRVNELLDAGWLFLTVTIDVVDRKFVFLMARHDRPRHEVFGFARTRQNADTVNAIEF